MSDVVQIRERGEDKRGHLDNLGANESKISK
jgi:hypothetical protein